MMNQRPPIIGERVEWQPPASLLGPELPSVEWYVLRSTPQKEVAACARLINLGVAEAWYPVEDVWRQKRGSLVPVKMQRRIAPGYIFTAWTHEPRWHLLRDRTRGAVASVVSLGDVPWCVPETAMAKMAKVPERIEAMRRDAEARFLAERAAREPRPGEPARLLSGPFTGEVVLVERVRGDRAEWSLGVIRGSASVTLMERVDMLGSTSSDREAAE
jgi:transcription antitermination factor NusG